MAARKKERNSCFVVCYTSAGLPKRMKKRVAAHTSWRLTEEELGPSRSCWKYSCIPRCALVRKAVPKLTDWFFQILRIYHLDVVVQSQLLEVPYSKYASEQPRVNIHSVESNAVNNSD